MPVHFKDLDNWFTHHPPEGDDAEHYEAIRLAGLVFAQAIILHTPASADQTAAVRKVREAVWTANSGLACRAR